MLVAITFQSTPSGGKATLPGETVIWIEVVSIHAFRGEGDSPDPSDGARGHGFNPRLPGGRRPYSPLALLTPIACFNPRLPGGRRLALPFGALSAYSVSIHAFRGEGDRRQLAAPQPTLPFQSTPSGGKATEDFWSKVVSWFDVSIHAFRGEGDRRARECRPERG